MLELAQQCSALPLLASGKQAHLTSVLRVKLNQSMPWATDLPRCSAPPLCPTRTLCFCKLPRRQDFFSCPALLWALLQSCSPAAAESCGSLCGAVLQKQTVGASKSCAGETDLEKDLVSSCPWWWDGQCGGVAHQVQNSSVASWRHVQAQLCPSANFSPACLSAVPRISSEPGFTSLATDKIVLVTEHSSLPVFWLFHQATLTFH